jgi:hypothetical protein
MWPTEPRLQPSNLNDSLFQISLGFARGPNMSLFIQQMFSENLPVVRLHVDMDQVEVLPVPWYLRDSLNSWQWKNPQGPILASSLLMKLPTWCLGSEHQGLNGWGSLQSVAWVQIFPEQKRCVFSNGEQNSPHYLVAITFSSYWFVW